jgi:ferredoxin
MYCAACENVCPVGAVELLYLIVSGELREDRESKMPVLSRWFIKIGMLYFVSGLMLAALLLAQPVMGWSASLQVLRPVYLHFLFIGWVTQIIMGVGYWMFPKYSKDNPRGSEKLGWAVFILLNLGLILRAIGEPIATLDREAGLGWMLAVASLCLLLAGWGFIFNTWGRIKER